MKIFFLTLFFLAACAQKPNLSHFAGTAFDIGYHIQIGHKLDEAQEKAVLSAIKDTFTLIDRRFNHWNPDSEIAKFNAIDINTPFAISDDLKSLLTLSIQLSHITQGLFDPTLGTLTAKLKEKKDIEPEAGQNYLKLENQQLLKEKPILVDLDGISKGYAIDLLVQKLANLGYENVYVEWGGEIRALGRHPANRPWRVLVQGGDDISIELCDEAVATSGDQLQRFDGVTHIIDPHTKQPLPIKNHFITVKAPSCALADSLATALMLCTSDEQIKAIINPIPNVKVWNENGLL